MKDSRQSYQKDGLYKPKIRGGLQGLTKKYEGFAEVFEKSGKMNPTLASAFEKLTLSIKSNDEQSVKNIDRFLELITKESDPLSVAFLLLSLEDDFQYDEGMFSVIHTAEAFDDQEYVAGFLTAIPHLLTTAPKWASVVFMRMLNSEETKRELIRALVKSNASVKKSVEDLCNRINGQNTDFLSKTVALLVATK